MQPTETLHYIPGRRRHQGADVGQQVRIGLEAVLVEVSMRSAVRPERRTKVPVRMRTPARRPGSPGRRPFGPIPPTNQIPGHHAAPVDGIASPAAWATPSRLRPISAQPANQAAAVAASPRAPRVGVQAEDSVLAVPTPRAKDQQVETPCGLRLLSRCRDGIDAVGDNVDRQRPQVMSSSAPGAQVGRRTRRSPTTRSHAGQVMHVPRSATASGDGSASRPTGS